MPRLRPLSGEELLRIFSKFGFDPVSQRGSHVKLRRSLPNGPRQILTAILHDEAGWGALHAIHRSVLASDTPRLLVQEPCRAEDADAAEGVQPQQRAISADYRLGVPGNRTLQHPVVFRVAACRDLFGGLDNHAQPVQPNPDLPQHLLGVLESVSKNPLKLREERP